MSRPRTCHRSPLLVRRAARRLAPLLLALACPLATTARAQEVMLPEPVATPAPGGAPKGEPELPLDLERDINLADIVTSAAKGTVTVQEAPAIITVITADAIKSRGFKWLSEALSTVPGWFPIETLGNQVTQPLVRGISQAALMLHDGISMFDPWGNVSWFGRTQPIETLKTIEVVTGPGGVLWGANSFLGVVNLTTKDAEDVNGLELSSGYGDGPGNKQDFKAYALFGKSFFDGKLKIFQHISYESFIGETFDIPQFIASAAAPQPAGIAYYGKNAPVDPMRSWMVIVDGKYSAGPVNLYYMLPFGDGHPNLTIASTTAPNNTWNQYDRYGILEYKDRYLQDRLQVNVKGYGIQFVRDGSLQLYPVSALYPATATTPGGLHFNYSGQKIFRFGGTADISIKLPAHLRLLFGGESFYEGVADSNEVFTSPSPNDVPIYCPVEPDGKGGFVRIPTCPRGYLTNDNRTVVAGYVDVQWRPFATLTIDGGVRLQAGFGPLGYGLQPLYSGAVVWNFLPNYHLKINYASGFRPPVFQDTSAAPGGVSDGSSRSLRNETSQSFQGEINARVLKNVKYVRTLELRADYSFTVLDDVINVQGGIYHNTGRRGIHSVEGYATLYLEGEHLLQASYTYLYQYASDFGVNTLVPHHWMSVGAAFNLIKNTLDVNINVFLSGGYDDPNRFPSQSMPAPGTTTGAQYTDLTLDRLTPVAVAQVGLRLRLLHQRMELSAQFYNVFNQHYYYPDPESDLAPTTNSMPNPAPGFNFFARIGYRF